MGIYLFAYLFILFVGLMFISYKKYNINYILLISWIIYVSIAACRSEVVGSDTVSYVTTFNLLNGYISVVSLKFFLISRMEIGYLYLVKLSTYFSTNYVISFFFQYGIIYGFMFFYFKKYSENILCSLLFFSVLIFPHTLNILRYYMMFSFFLFTLILIEKKQYIVGTIILILSIYIHKSAFILMPIILFYFILRKTKKFIWLWLIFSIIGIFAITESSFLSKLLGLLDYSQYQFNKYSDASQSNGFLSYIYTFICLIGILPIIKEKNLNEKYIFYLVLSIIGTVFMLLAHKSVIMSRAGRGYVFFISLLLPMIVNYLVTKKYMQYIIYSIIYVFLFIAIFISMQGYEYVPFFR